jgi:hypothetical protein
VVAAQKDLLFPGEALERLLEGSYEQRIAQMDRALGELNLELFESDDDYHLVGTFPKAAVVVSKSGRFKRIVFEKTEEGLIARVEEEAVPIISKEEANAVLNEAAQDVVGDLLEGQNTSERLLLLADKVGSRPLSEGDTVDKAVASIGSPRPWRQIYEEKKDVFYREVGAGAEEVVGKVKPTFARLYETEQDEEFLEKFLPLVREKLKKLAESLDDLAFAVESSLESLSDCFVDRGFAFFVADLAADLKVLEETASNAVIQLTESDSMGRLYDTIAAEFSSYELAGRFVQEVATRLVQEGRKRDVV